MAQKTKPRSSRPVIEPKKVVELGVYVSAPQLYRLERMIRKWGIEVVTLPECEPPYANLREWFEECSETKAVKA